MKPESVSAFRKSSYSGQEGNCVEVADDAPGVIPVRDSKAPGGPHLVFAAHAWTAFVETLKSD
ncbi:DUF397 domain-containing protein [Streptomyces sp. NPDC048650]|uniref:DUF397 domain-containing protein n=1 Tax=Streptomyces sp. NPDC048650 TaxID=3365583 RepID=UPI003716F68D